MHLHFWGGAHTGKLRARNEDAWAIAPYGPHGHWMKTYPEYTRVHFEHEALLLVADGMGGLPAGDVASQCAVEAFLAHMQQYDQRPESSKESRDCLDAAFHYAHEKIADYQNHHPGHQGMGTTLAVAWLCETQWHVAWVGDSRAYLLNPGKEDHPSPFTHDHSYVGELVREGSLSWEEARQHPMAHVLSRAVGGAGAPEVEFREAPLHEGQWLLLSTDGLHDMLSNQEIEATIRASTYPEEAGPALMNQALAAGGHDNITLCIARPMA